MAATAGLATPALALTPDQLCGERAGSSAASDEVLDQAAATIETYLQRERAALVGERIEPAALEVSSAATAAPSAAAIARYCSAAGELMRLAPNGSQRQAQIFLQTALRKGREARLPAVTALTAYRLGVVSISGTSVSSLRGAGGVRRNGAQIVRRLRSAQTAETSGGQVCAALADIAVGSSADPSLSMLALDCAARLALDSGRADISALATLRFARFALDWADSADDPQELLRVARDNSLAALAVAERISEPGLRIEMLSRLARTALQLGAPAGEPLRRAVAAIRAAAPQQPQAMVAANELGAQLSLAAGDFARGRRLLEEAVLHESARAVPVRLPELYLLLAEAEPAQRARHVAAAYATLQNIRPRLPRLDPLTEEPMFSLHMRRVFESAAETELNHPSDDVSGSHIQAAQQIVEAYREAELESAVGSECLPERSAVKPEDLSPGEVLLYPLLFKDRVELIYATGGENGTRQFRRLPPNRTANRPEIAKLAETLVLRLTRSSGHDWRAAATRLYDILIRPIEPHLSSNSTLAIIPDGPLRGVPFAALLSADGRYLLERTSVTVAPALAYSQPGNVRDAGRLSIVAASLGKRVSLPAGDFSALAGTSAEARIAASNGSPGKLVENFTRAQLLAALKGEPVDVLHLATHAAFNGRSDRAFIVADGEVIRLSELRDILAQNRVKGELLDLLVLSACETAVGDDEASMGLAGAAVQAGALSAIASLWQVDDVGTAELMRNFYASYRVGKSRASALREAQLSLLKGGGDNSDPFVWAAFTLLGAWR